MIAMRNNFYEFLGSIDRGDRKIFILVTSGRNGSNLLQSLFDSHSSILMMPTLFWFYSDWKRLIGVEKQISLQEAIDFLRSSSYAQDWYTVGLGDDRDESIFLDRSKIEAMIIELAGASGKVTRRELLTMLHYAYGVQKYEVLDDKALILFHHHFPLSSIGEDYFDPSKTVRLPVTDDLHDLLEDFPLAGVLHSIRNPYSTYLSSIDADFEPGKPLNIRQHFFQTLGLLSGYDLAIKRSSSLVNRFSGGYWLVRYEDLHSDPAKVLIKLTTAFGVRYEDVLLESTFDGKRWWGNNPAKPFNGTSPDFVRRISADKLSRYVTNGLWDCLDKLAFELGYEIIDRPLNSIQRLSHHLHFSWKLIRSWIISCLRRIIVYENYSVPNIKFLIYYQSYWRQMISIYRGK